MRFLPRKKVEPKGARRSFLDDLYSMTQQWNTGSGVYGQFNNGMGFNTTYGQHKGEPIGADFRGLVQGALKSNGIVSAITLHRQLIFSEARFQFQALNGGRPGDLFGTPALASLEHPFPGGTTGDMLSRMLMDADFAGNAYNALIDGEIVRLRPDWVEIILSPRMLPIGPDNQDVQVGFRREGYYYYENGPGLGKTPAVFLPEEVSHFAPYPDPEFTFRGMSLWSSVIREIQADGLATRHKEKFFENAATPNLHVGLPSGPTPMTPDQFDEWIDKMDSSHKGVANAYKTLYTANGADVTVIGANMQQLDFKATQGAGETRMAAAGKVHPVLLGLSEGLAGSSLNAGNYAAAKRSFADGTMRPLWRNVASSLEVLIPAPSGSRLWYDDRDIAYLREDQKDAAEIQSIRAISIKTLVDSGFDPATVVKAVTAEDNSLLKHSGLYSVQLQEPGSKLLPTDIGAGAPTPPAPPAPPTAGATNA